MSRTILLADDSVTIQKVIELTFMDEDWEVVALGNGDEALEKLDAMTPDFVIADVHMPGASGYDVAKHSKSLRPEVPVLLLVSTFEPFDEEEAERSGCDAFLKKPFDSQELQRLVEELSAEASGEPRAPKPTASEEPAPELEVEDDTATPFSIGLDEDDEEPPTRVAPPPTVGEPPAWGPSFGDDEVGATEADPAVFEMAPEDFEAAEEIELAPEEEAPPAAPPPPAEAPAIQVEGPLSDDDVDRIARRVVELLGDRPIRDVAWEVVPDLAEVVIRDRLKELESQVEAAD